MPVIYNKKVEYAYTDPGVKAHTISWAEYQALSEDDKMNGDLYFIPDKQPEGNPSRIWTKLGTDPLTTQADDVSGAVNELNSSITSLNTKVAVKEKTVTGTTNAYGAIALGLAWATNEIISVSTSDSIKWCIPFAIGSSYYVRVLADVSTYAPSPNISVTLTVRYREYTL